MHTADIAQQGLVDAACEIEAEVGILTETHIGEVLVRHRLDDGAGHLRHAALRVVAVEEFAALPLVVDGLHLVGDDSQQLVSEVTRGQSTAPCAEDTVVHKGGADGKGSCVCLAVSRIAGVAMYGQSEFYGNIAACRIWHVARASGEFVGHA